MCACMYVHSQVIALESSHLNIKNLFHGDFNTMQGKQTKQIFLTQKANWGFMDNIIDLHA